MEPLWLVAALGLVASAGALLYRHFRQGATEGPTIAVDTVVGGLLIAGSLIALVNGVAP